MENKKWFKIIIIAAVLIIPFMYSFFYLKAYWDPYGKGNIDNISVAIVNEDEGKNGKELVKQLIDSKKLKIETKNEKNATDGLYAGKYFAVITIPKDFTQSIESIKTENKIHPVITYSPNEKTSYLATQIINNVVNKAEESLDNKVNSQIVGTLTSNLKEVPNKLETISDGFNKLEDGTNELSNGSNTLAQGINTLSENYTKFNEGINKVKNGANTLNEATKQFSQINSSLEELESGVNNLNQGSETLNNGLNNYVKGTNQVLGYTQNLTDLINATICPKVTAGTATNEEINMCAIAQGLSKTDPTTNNTTVINYLKESGEALTSGSNTLNNGTTELKNKVSNLNSVKAKVNELQNGINELATATDTLYDSSNKISDGINNINSGANKLNSGINTLNNSVKTAKTELNNNIEKTKEETKKLNGLQKYSKNPVNIKTKAVNKVPNYGTAFSPFFLSIGLWVGCLMMYIVLYYDQDNRFKLLGKESKDKVKRALAYHGLATISSIILGIILQLLLNFNITSIPLYYLTLVLVANTFMAVIQFLIERFDDIGKFLALILLVLQLAASGGTFPIQTVAKCFRWLNPLLPMTYTIKLFKEPLVSIENKLLTQNLLIVFMIFIVFFIINISIDIYQQKQERR